MPFNTRNPIPSGDLRDLDDNARNIDTWANDKTKLSHPDRFGVQRRTWHGIEKEAKLNIQQAIDAKNAAQEAAMMSGFSKYADTLAQLEAGIGTDYVDGDVVMVFQDESRGDTSSIFKIESGTAEFKLTFDKTRQDLLSFTGTISADAEWADVPAHSDPALDAQAQALANRTDFITQELTQPSGDEPVGGFASYAELAAYTGPATVIPVGVLTTAPHQFVIYERTATTDAVNGGTIIADGLGRKWEIRGWRDGVIWCEWFGAKGDFTGTVDVGTGTDNTAAIQAALTAAYKLAPQTGWRFTTSKVKLGRGRFLVSQPNTLFAGLAAFSGVLEGEGMHGVTEIIYRPVSPSSSDYFINNDNLFGFFQFKDIRLVAPTSENHRLMRYYSNGTAQGLTFDSVSIYGFSDLIETSGPIMTSEVTFLRCKIASFVNGFKFNNPQGVNWRFYATDMESFTGVLFEYLQGAAVTVSGGSSIISNASTARVIKVPAGANSNQFGGTNSPHLLLEGNTRLELRNGSLLIEKYSEKADFMLSLENCGMGGYNIPSGVKVIKWHGAGQITARNCRNMSNYKISWTGLGGDIYLPRFTFNNCDLPADFIKSSDFTLTSTPGNVARLPLFDISNCNAALNGNYRPTNNKLPTPLGLSKLNSYYFSNAQYSDVFLVASSGAFIDIPTPPTHIHKVTVVPTTTTGYGAATATITLVVRDESDVVVATLGTASWTINAGSIDPIDIYAKYSLSNNQKLSIKVENTYTAGFVIYRGSMLVMY